MISWCRKRKFETSLCLYRLACDDPQRIGHSGLPWEVLHKICLPSKVTLTSGHKKREAYRWDMVGLKVKNLVQTFSKLQCGKHEEAWGRERGWRRPPLRKLGTPCCETTLKCLISLDGRAAWAAEKVQRKHNLGMEIKICNLHGYNRAYYNVCLYYKILWWVTHG